MTEPTDPALKQGSSLGTLLVLVVVLAAIAYAGKMFYAEVTTLNNGTTSTAVSPPAPSSPAPAPLPGGETPAQQMERKVNEVCTRIHQKAGPRMDEIDRALDRKAALTASQNLEQELSQMVAQESSQLRAELQGIGADAGMIDDGCKRIDTYARQWTQSASERAQNIPATPPPAPVGSGPMPATPVGGETPVAPATPDNATATEGECIEPVTELGREDAMKYGVPPKQVDTYTKEVQALAARWPFIVRTHAERSSADADFIWNALCTQDERNRAKNEFEKKDLLASKQSLYEKGLEDAKAAKRIRYRTTLRFGNYDFGNKQLALQNPLQAQVVSPNRRGGVIRAYRMTARGISDQLVSPLAMEEEVARKIIGDLDRRDSRYMFCDIEGTIVNANESAMLLQVRVSKMTLTTTDGAKSWNLPVD